MGVLCLAASFSRLQRVSQGVYRIPFLPAGQLGAYMEAALWPVGVKGVLSHATLKAAVR